MRPLQCGMSFCAIVESAVSAHMETEARRHSHRQSNPERGPAMTTMTRIRAAMERRRRYNETVREIERMPLDVALDLNIHRGDAHHIARRAVYGV